MGPYLAVGAIINSIVLLQLGHGLLTAVLPLRMQSAGFSSSEVGIMAAGFSLGFLLGCLYAPGLIARIGHIRAFSCFATTLSALTLAYAIDTDLFLWTAARILSGLCFAGLLTVSDSWISGETDKSVRGQVMSVYMVLYKLAQAAGPMLLTYAVIAGNWHFMLVSALFSLSLVPLAWRHGGNPTPPSNDRLGLLEVYRITPLAVVGCVCLGIGNSGLINMIPLYGVEIGLGIAGAAVLATALQMGALFVQWPMGWASDHTDRRVVMIAGVAAVALLCLIGILVPSQSLWFQIVLITATGGFALSVYPIMLSHASDFVPKDQIVPLCATLMLAFAGGMTIGPLSGAAMMDLLGPTGLLIHSLFFCTVFIAFALYRMRRRAAPPTPDRRGYVNVPASSVAISQLDPRAPHPEVDESIAMAFGEDEKKDEGGDPATARH